MISCVMDFCRFCHIVESVLISPVMHCMASWVSCRFLIVEFLSLISFDRCIPWYAFAYVRVASLAPLRSNSIGTFRSSTSGSCLFAPCLARWSLSLFPVVLLCPLIHWNVVWAGWYLNRCAAFLNSAVFFMLIQPSFSQFSRCVVNPSVMYLESVMILRGW